ncbi:MULTISPECIES: DNA helicase II [unclassified Methylophaga]|jgi:DNA helicase-2/ATP-dependent DNA helicase PcrA|uniref:DNA helicase II n=1 Tax=unclassified Methylophaga TaxID=2629249 RepID=UPI000C94F54C|nr:MULTISPECIES: DNA helicase II [unclassified Methylophaga]MAP26237.1 DNA helicase II [Methylophaga sp.]HCO00373.1 DNA helicase II [Methylophaga sp.]|tara:strand:+ start:48663 stop:50825 length:2163 start_codon:yes stop_codon:yes gene_type:complete
MDVSELLDDLNKPQREAVAAPLGHTRILAGAGSGKTRVLVHRIAWLIQAEALSPANILAVTFTNKAAAEMRGRIEQMLGYPIGGMWVGTFHGLAHRLLRSHWQEAGLPQGFQILDSDDQLRMIKRIIRGMSLDEAQWPPKQAQWYINGQKDEGLRAAHLQAGEDPYSQNMLAIYLAYEQACERAGVVDFGELLLRSHELWLKRPDILSHYQQRFSQILVDEFQDTNTIQYAWIRVLAGQTGHLFIVGDDDQSIYGWRGAKIENIQKFHKDYPDASTVRLEQNYRSTGNILAVANAVIKNNSERLGKELWTEDADGEPIQLYNAYNERDEAAYLVQEVRNWMNQGGQRSDVAVLYRSNAQSRVIEEALMQSAVPYRVYGGLRFFERAEIKDVLSYLRLVSNRRDDAAFERIVNTPTRGIGAATLTQLRQYARETNQSMWQSAVDTLQQKVFPARAANALSSFLELIDSLTPEDDTMSLHELTALVIDESGLRTHFAKDKTEKGQGRIENMDELINASREFMRADDEEEMPLLDAFLAHAALEAGENQGDQWQDCVQLMTLHSAKGLEFPIVFMVGMEEGLFPGQKSADDPLRLAEERRLCYVGMTRARKTLYLLYTESRYLYGQEMHPRPSRFLSEIPAERVHQVRSPQNMAASGLTALASRSQSADDNGFRTGQQVMHQKFGQGVIIDTEGNGSHARVHVNFKQAGSKWLVLAYAKLETL